MMNVLIKIAGSISLAAGIQVIAFGNIAALAAQADLLAASTAEFGSAALQDTSTYQPPDNGGPDSTQGSGTR